MEITPEILKKVVRFHNENSHLSHKELAEHFEFSEFEIRSILRKARQKKMTLPVVKSQIADVRTRRNLVLKLRIDCPLMSQKEIAETLDLPVKTIEMDFSFFRKNAHPFFVDDRKLPPAERLEKIEEACEIHKEITAQDLSEMFQVDESVINKDLKKLEIFESPLYGTNPHALIEALQIKRIVDVFKRNPRLTYLEISKKTGIRPNTVKRLMKALSDEIKERELTTFYLRREIEDAEYQKHIDELQQAWEATSAGTRGAPRYKELILKAMADRARMLGLDSPIKIDVIASAEGMTKEDRDKFVRDRKKRIDTPRPRLVMDTEEEIIDVAINE